MSATRTVLPAVTSAYTLDGFAERIEHPSVLDGVGSAFARVIDHALPDGAMRDVALADTRNAGAEWRDEESFTCPAKGFTLVTSREPDDLDAFNAAAVAAFAG